MIKWKSNSGGFRRLFVVLLLLVVPPTPLVVVEAARYSSSELECTYVLNDNHPNDVVCATMSGSAGSGPRDDADGSGYSGYSNTEFRIVQQWVSQRLSAGDSVSWATNIERYWARTVEEQQQVEQQIKDETCQLPKPTHGYGDYSYNGFVLYEKFIISITNLYYNNVEDDELDLVKCVIGIKLNGIKMRCSTCMYHLKEETYSADCTNLEYGRQVVQESAKTLLYPFTEILPRPNQPIDNNPSSSPSTGPGGEGTKHTTLT